MKRRLAAITVLVLLLAACKRSGEFSPAEVLRRATLQNAQLPSARFTALVGARVARGTLQTDVKAQFDGSLVDGGTQTSTTMTADGTIVNDGRKSSFRLEGDILTELQKNTYFFVKEFSVDPPQPWAASVHELLGTWWKIPGGEKDSAAIITPDPKFLRMQAEIVSVVADHGLVELHGRDVYRYDVTIDPEKLIAFLKASAAERGETFDEAATRRDLLRYEATGELWIDAETFVLHRLRWVVSTKNDPDGLRLSIDMELRDHGQAMPISPPAQFTEFRSQDFLQKAFPASPTP